MTAMRYWKICPVAINRFLKDRNELEHGKNISFIRGWYDISDITSYYLLVIKVTNYYNFLTSIANNCINPLMDNTTLKLDNFIKMCVYWLVDYTFT